MIGATGVMHCCVRRTAGKKRFTGKERKIQDRQQFHGKLINLGGEREPLTIIRILINLLENDMFNVTNRIPYLCFLIPVPLDTKNERTIFFFF